MLTMLRTSTEESYAMYTPLVLIDMISGRGVPWVDLQIFAARTGVIF